LYGRTSFGIRLSGERGDYDAHDRDKSKKNYGKNVQGSQAQTNENLFWGPGREGGEEKIDQRKEKDNTIAGHTGGGEDWNQK